MHFADGNERVFRGRIYGKKENEKTFIICTLIKEKEREREKEKGINFLFFLYYLNERRTHFIEHKNCSK
jgi:hypothetical protein